MTYFIAICDDKEADRKRFRNFVESDPLFNEDMEIREYSNGKQLLWDIDGGCFFHVLLLDRQLGDMDGQEVARRVKKMGYSPIVAFFSGVSDPDCASLRVGGRFYLKKDERSEVLKEEVNKILLLMLDEYKQPSAAITADGRVYRVKLKDIIYMAIYNRGTRVVLTEQGRRELNQQSNEIISKRKIDELYEELAGQGFAMAQKSCLVNFEHVVTDEKGKLLMDNNEDLRVSRGYASLWGREFTSYMGGQSYRREKRG